MNLFNIETEVEVLTGEVAKFSKFYKHNQKKRREETRSKLKDIVLKLMKGLTQRFFAVSGTDKAELAQECLYLAYTSTETRKFYGFPWVIAHNYLLRPGTQPVNLPV